MNVSKDTTLYSVSVVASIAALSLLIESIVVSLNTIQFHQFVSLPSFHNFVWIDIATKTTALILKMPTKIFQFFASLWMALLQANAATMAMVNRNKRKLETQNIASENLLENGINNANHSDDATGDVRLAEASSFHPPSAPSDTTEDTEPSTSSDHDGNNDEESSHTDTKDEEEDDDATNEDEDDESKTGDDDDDDTEDEEEEDDNGDNPPPPNAAPPNQVAIQDPVLLNNPRYVPCPYQVDDFPTRKTQVLERIDGHLVDSRFGPGWTKIVTKRVSPNTDTDGAIDHTWYAPNGRTYKGMNAALEALGWWGSHGV